MIRICALLLFFILLPAGVPADNQQTLSLQDGWVRAMPPNSKMTAGFGRLRNNGESDVIITGWGGHEFADVSLHQTIEEEGVSRMKSVKDLTLTAGSELIMEPGGYHLMLMKPVKTGLESVRIWVELDNGSQFEFTLPVERR